MDQPTGTEPDGPTSGWIVTPSPPSAGRTGWSLWWRWVAWTVVGGFGTLLVVVTILYAGGFRSGAPWPNFALFAAGLAASVTVGALQSRLLRGHVRAPRLWLVIAILGGVFAGLVVIRADLLGHTVPGAVGIQPAEFLWNGLEAAGVALAQWWFVLRADVPRSAAWVPISIAATLVPLVVVDVLAAAGLNAVVGPGLLNPAIAATGMVYLLREEPPHARGR